MSIPNCSLPISQTDHVLTDKVEPRLSTSLVSNVTAGWMRDVPPPVLLLIAIVSMQIGTALAVGLFEAVGPIATASGRIVIAAAILLIMNRPSMGRATLRHALPVVVFGITIAVMNCCIYAAMARIPMGIAITIEFLGPLGLAAVTSRRLIDFAWIGLAVLGLLFLIPGAGHSLNGIGVLYALGGAICWAGYVLCSKWAGRYFPGQSGLSLGMLVAALLVLPMLAMFPPVASPSLPTMLLIGAVAMLSTVLPWSCEYVALQKMPPRVYGVLVTLEPAVATIMGALMLHQLPGLHGMAAILLVTVASLGAALKNR